MLRTNQIRVLPKKTGFFQKITLVAKQRTELRVRVDEEKPFRGNFKNLMCKDQRWWGYGEMDCFPAPGHNVNRTHGMSRTISRNLTCSAEWMVQPSPETQKDRK